MPSPLRPVATIYHNPEKKAKILSPSAVRRNRGRGLVDADMFDFDARPNGSELSAVSENARMKP